MPSEEKKRNPKAYEDEMLDPPDPGDSGAKFLGWIKKRGFIVTFEEAEAYCNSTSIDLKGFVKDMGPEYIKMGRTGSGSVAVKEKQLEHGRLPFGGLFGNSVLLRVLREIVADPHREFRPKELEVLTSSSAPRIKNTLDALMSQGLLQNISKDAQRPVYKANLECKRLTALTLLVYAVTDDRDGTCCMEDAIRHYYEEDLHSESKAHDSDEISISADGSKEIRIYMFHTAAEKLSEKLGLLLEDAYKRGEMEIGMP